MIRLSKIATKAAELRGHAEARLRKQAKLQKPAVAPSNSEADTQRLFHELQVHQVELEVQNTELRESWDRADALLQKYTDLYDFAPIGYFSLDERGRIIEVNLAGAALLGVERSALIKRLLPRFVVRSSQPLFLAFLERVFAGTGKQVCEAALLREDAAALWAAFHGNSTISVSGPPKRCRLAVLDITTRKEAEEAQQRLEALMAANRELEREIILRRAAEQSLRKSEQHSSRLLEESQRMQKRLRLLSRKVLLAQEEERKKISRELHDVVAQTLTGINVHLATLKKDVALNPQGIEENIALTQQLVEESVDIVHRFARELRPTVLDDLGLIPALHTFMKQLRAETGIRVSLSAFGGVEQVSSDKRTVLYRVAQEALTNVVRHAQASQAEVKIEKLDGNICMEISDNGRGFQKERLLHAKTNNRLGLLGMRERLEMLGGTFTVTSALRKGTTVLAKIPVIGCTSRGEKLADPARS